MSVIQAESSFAGCASSTENQGPSRGGSPCVEETPADGARRAGFFDEGEVQTDILSAHDVLTARQMVRYGAIALGFDRPDATLLAAAISEVARNIIDYADGGEMMMCVVRTGGRRGLRITARDRGPGIPDVAHAMQYGSSARPGPGVGLPGARLLVDEFDIISRAGFGTTVTMTKWAPS